MRPRTLAPVPTLLLALCLCVGAPAALADGFTDRSAFEAAVAALDGVEAIESFDSLPADSVLADGASTARVTFFYDFGEVNMQVLEVSATPSEFSTTSLPHYLGTDDGGIFQGGDAFDVGLGPGVRAVGLSITSIDVLMAGDVRLSTAETTIELDPAQVQSVLADGASEYFLGIVEDSPFTEIRLTSEAGGFFLYTIDDLTLIKPADIFSDRFEF
jgi:hypothetical protein